LHIHNSLVQKSAFFVTHSRIRANIQIFLS
jgi:hypothetical protein